MAKYKVGDKVRIVDERTSLMNENGEMDKYLGEVMTVDKVRENLTFKYKMLEDGGEWGWKDEMILCLASDKIELHPDFKGWYGEIKDHWGNGNSSEPFAIFVINQMGFGQGLKNSYEEDVSYDYPELRGEMQANKEKYTRAILDDNWTVRKEKLYYVELPYVRNGRFLNQCTLTREIIISDSDECLDYKTKFTEKEIKAIDERYFAFAEPVEED